MKNITIIAAFVLLINYGYAQSSYADNDPLGNSPMGFLGWDDTGNQNLDIFQNNTLRQRLTSLPTYTGINGYTVSNAYRTYFSENGNFQTPYSMLHMGSNVSTTMLQRPWMNVGVTMTSSQDILHLGIIDRPVSSTANQQIDAVLAWGCNPGSGAAGPDNFRFLFLQPTNVFPSTDAATQQGRETMRITPLGNVGIGDFSHMPNGLNEQPTQKLDVDGTARLRQVPDNEPHVLITGRKQDVNPTDGDYVLNYLGFSGNGNEVLNGDGIWVEMEAADCDWQVIENVPGIDDVVTGHGDNCYSAGHAGVGVTVPEAKLEVYHSQTQVNPKAQAGLFRWEESQVFPFGLAHGLNVQLRRADEFGLMGQGIYSRSSGSERNWAGRFDALAGTVTGSNVGVEGISYHNVNSTVMYESIGGRFQGSALPESGLTAYGVYSQAMGGQVAYGKFAGAGGASIDNWAGYFVGDTWSTGFYLGSDAALKQNVETLENALDVIQQIEPKNYEFLTDQYSQMNLPAGNQQGVIAQELEEVLPNLVKATTFPAQYDTLGNVVTEAVEFKSVNYTGLIPYLIAGMKEQQTIIENQNDALAQMKDQLAAMQQQINDCCNSGEGNRTLPSGVIQPQDLNNQKSLEGGNELFQNIPNPFRESTTISYSLEEGGRVQLSIYDKTGKVVTTLADANQGPGRYSEVWNANGMPSGVYHYALYVNGELLVKRAIKLQE
jgi:hypothetical protein